MLAPFLRDWNPFGSSEPVLNLGRDGQASVGVFRRPLLARAFLVKHRVARGEQALIEPAPTSATRLNLRAPGFRQHHEGSVRKDYPIAQFDVCALALLRGRPAWRPSSGAKTF